MFLFQHTNCEACVADLKYLLVMLKSSACQKLHCWQKWQWYQICWKLLVKVTHSCIAVHDLDQFVDLSWMNRSVRFGSGRKNKLFNSNAAFGSVRRSTVHLW